MEIIKVFIPGLVAFVFGVAITPIILAKLYKYKVWRKNSSRKNVLLEDKTGNISKIINKTDRDIKTPRMGGLVIIFSVFFSAFIFWLVSLGLFGHSSGWVDFISRSQTWIPLTTFFVGFIMGFLDDYFTIKNTGRFNNGLPLFYRITFVLSSAIFIGWWLLEKVNIHSLYLPFYGQFELGLFFLPLFVIVFVAVFGTSNIDGLDGLAGGIMSIVYFALGTIAFFQNKFDIATFCFVIVGALFAFLWFNISPAKFYMGEVGYDALSFTLVIIAFLTNTVFLLPIIASMLFINLLVTVIQVFAIRVFGKRVFKAAPLHHHFELKGWSESQIVFRFWLVSIVFAIIGIILAIFIK